MSNLSGTVFILVNDAMPHFTRLDFTAKDDAALKIAKLNKAALPVPFRPYLVAEVADWKALERSLRFLFSSHYDAADPAFLTINPDLLRAAIEPSILKITELSDDDVKISAQKRAQMDQLRISHENLKMQACKVEAGTNLYFAHDHSISCTALGDGLVQYDGAPTTPALAAKAAIRRLGFDWDEIAGTEYWITLDAGPHAKLDLDVEVAHGDAAMPEMPIVPNDADSSPVMVIRNKKI